MGCCLSGEANINNKAEIMLIFLLESMRMNNLNFSELQEILSKFKPDTINQASKFPNIYKLITKQTKRIDPIHYELLISDLLSQDIYKLKYMDYIKSLNTLERLVENEFTSQALKKRFKFKYILNKFMFEYEAIDLYIKEHSQRRLKMGSSNEVMGGRRKSLLANEREGVEKQSALIFNLQRAIFPDSNEIKNLEYDIYQIVFVYLNKDNLYPLDIVRIISNIISKYEKPVQRNNVKMKTNQPITNSMHTKHLETVQDLQRIGSKHNLTQAPPDKSTSNLSLHYMKVEENTHYNNKSNEDEVLDEDSKLKQNNMILQKLNSGDPNRVTKAVNKADLEFFPLSGVNINLVKVIKVENVDEKLEELEKPAKDETTTPFSQSELYRSIPCSVETLSLSQFWDFLRLYLKFNLFEITKNFFKFLHSDSHYEYLFNSIYNIEINESFKLELRKLFETYYTESMVSKFINYIKDELRKSIDFTNSKLVETTSSFKDDKHSELLIEHYIEFVELHIYLFNIRSLRQSYINFCVKNKEENIIMI